MSIVYPRASKQNHIVRFTYSIKITRGTANNETASKVQMLESTKRCYHSNSSLKTHCFLQDAQRVFCFNQKKLKFRPKYQTETTQNTNGPQIHTYCCSLQCLLGVNMILCFSVSLLHTINS